MPLYRTTEDGGLVRSRRLDPATKGGQLDWNFDGAESLLKASQQIGGLIEERNQLQQRFTDLHDQAIIDAWVDETAKLSGGGGGPSMHIPDSYLRAIGRSKAKQGMGQDWNRLVDLETTIDAMISTVDLSEHGTRSIYNTAQVEALQRTNQPA